MATKYLKMNRSLKTRIGLLRFGMTYPLDDSEKRVADVIKATTNKGTKDDPKIPAGILVTKKKVDEERLAVESLVPIEEPISLSGDIAKNLSDALGAIEALKTTNDNLTKAGETKDAEIISLKKQVGSLEQSLIEVGETHGIAMKAARNAFDESELALTEATAKITELESALAEATKPAGTEKKA